MFLTVHFGESKIMGLRSYLKNTAKDNSNVKKWSSWDSVADQAKVIGSFVKDFNEPAVAPVKTTFEEAVKRYGLSEHDIQARMKSHLFVSIICAILCVFAFAWAIFLLAKLMILSSLVSLSLAVLMFAYGFRENFFYFQLKQRRLDCTFREWMLSFYPKKKH